MKRGGFGGGGRTTTMTTTTTTTTTITMDKATERSGRGGTGREVAGLLYGMNTNDDN